MSTSKSVYAVKLSVDGIYRVKYTCQETNIKRSINARINGLSNCSAMQGSRRNIDVDIDIDIPRLDNAVQLNTTIVAAICMYLINRSPQHLSIVGAIAKRINDYFKNNKITIRNYVVNATDVSYEVWSKGKKVRTTIIRADKTLMELLTTLMNIITMEGKFDDILAACLKEAYPEALYKEEYIALSYTVHDLVLNDFIKPYTVFDNNTLDSTTSLITNAIFESHTNTTLKTYTKRLVHVVAWFLQMKNFVKSDEYKHFPSEIQNKYMCITKCIMDRLDESYGEAILRLVIYHHDIHCASIKD